MNTLITINNNASFMIQLIKIIIINIYYGIDHLL